ncbi:MAG: ankyrin repeat domain-containing protein, partial [Candidatus Babeliales bacterium]
MNRIFLNVFFIVNLLTIQLHAVEKEWLAAGMPFLLGGNYYQFITKPKRIEKEKQFLAAAKEGNIAFCKDYLQEGGNVNAADENGYTALHYAAEKGDLYIVRYLVDAKHIDLIAQENAQKNLPIHRAAEYGHEQVVAFLAEYGSPINKQNNDGFSPLHYAAQQGNVAIVRKLLERKASRALLTNNNNSPLHIALTNKHVDIAELLADQAVVNVKNDDGNTPLMLASYFGYQKIARLLLDNYNVSINKKGKNGSTALFIAARQNNKTMVELLLRYNAAPDIADNENNTPLWWAAKHGNTNMIEFLYHSDERVNQKGKGGRTPLAIAAANGKQDAVDLLIRFGACVNIHDNQNNTPFLLAVQGGHMHIVNYFLRYHKNDIDIEESDWRGNTALMKAAEYGHGEVVKILLGQKANIYHKNCFRQQAHIVARGTTRSIILDYKNKYDKECVDMEKLQSIITSLIRQCNTRERIFTYTRRELEEMSSVVRQEKIRELQLLHNKFAQQAEKLKQEKEDNEQMQREYRSIFRLQQGIKKVDQNNKELDRELRKQDLSYTVQNCYRLYSGKQFSEQMLHIMTSSQRKQIIKQLSQEQEKREQEKIKLEEKLKQKKQGSQAISNEKEGKDKKKCFICMDEEADGLLQEVVCSIG